MIRVPSREDEQREKKRCAAILKILKAEARKELNTNTLLTTERRDLLKYLLSKKIFGGDLWSWCPSEDTVRKLQDKQLIEGRSIFADVPRREHDDITQNYDEEIREMLPHAERGYKVMHGWERSGGRPRVTDRNTMYQQMADEIWKKHLGWSKMRVAKSLEASLLEAEKGKKRSKKNPKLPGWNSIRRIINKPT